MSQFFEAPMRPVSRAAAPERVVVMPHGYTVHWRGKRGELRSGRVSKTVLFSLVAACLGLAVWAAAVTAYLMQRDDMVLRASWQGTDHAYEDRIANLSGMLDRVTSKQLIEREILERKVEGLLKRQAMIETRQSLVGQMMDTITLPPASSAVKGAPWPLPPERDSVPEPSGERHSQRSGAGDDLHGAVAQLAQRMDANEQASIAHLARVESETSRKSRRLKSVFADIGFEPPAVPKDNKGATAMGGPFVPLAGAAFDQQLERLRAAMAEIETLERTVAQLPLRRPLPVAAEQTSGFGARIDPFLKSWALHAGVDFRGNTGDIVRVTAGGRVIYAGWQAGYGLMVDVEHAGGIATRYAHLSQIDVSVGDGLRVGQPLGRVGSTGRSTGPHLHYETRIDGEAVDPMRFLRAGAKISAH